MKNRYFLPVLFFLMVFFSCKSENPSSSGSKAETGKAVTTLTGESFRKLVFNYETNKEWKYEGDTPAIIDFYADWCPPCRQLSPLVEEIAKEYNGKIVVYKVDTDKEKDLAQSVGISNLPTLLYIPVSGKPQVTIGFIPKETIIKTISEVLLIK
jgi:thioredoxin 1